MAKVPYNPHQAFVFATFWFLFIKYGPEHSEKIKAEIAEQKPVPLVQVVDYHTFAAIDDLTGRYVCDRACNHFYRSWEFKEAWTQAVDLVLSERRNDEPKDDE